MGPFAIRLHVKLLAWLISAILIYVNVSMISNDITSAFQSNIKWGGKLLIIVACIIFALLFLLMTILPVIKKQKSKDTLRMHADAAVLQRFKIPRVDCIATALDFSNNDERLIAHALSQGNKLTRFFLLHIVESASARTLGDVSDDYETRKDKEHMQSYVDQLQQLGYSVEGQLGYRNRIKEIIRFVTEAKANLLVIGAHRHAGIMNYLYGETVERVRHKVRIPVLIVN